MRRASLESWRQDIEDVGQTMPTAMAAGRGKAKKSSWGAGRTHTVRVRVSEEERRWIREHADAAGLALSTYIRQATLNEKGVGVLTHATLQALRYRLRRIHTHLQRARLQTGTEECAEHLREATLMLDEIIRGI